MKDSRYRVFVERPSWLAIRECVGSTVFEASGAEIFPNVRFRCLASAGGVHAHASEQTCGAKPTTNASYTVAFEPAKQ